MGGLFHLVDLNQGEMARKVATQKRHGGLEAPRNSLELPLETCQSYFTAGDDWSEKNYYPTEAPIKKLISEEISRKPKTRSNSPSIVARLMGVDALPLDTKTVDQQVEKKIKNIVTEYPEEKLGRTSSVSHGNFSSKSSRHRSSDSFHRDEDSDHDEWSGSFKSRKPKPREHPQEEELQKFKKEFEAWQATWLKECSKIVECGTTPSQWMAHENLNREKMIMYANPTTKSEKVEEVEGNTQKARTEDRSSSRTHGYENQLMSADRRSRTLSRDFELPLSLSPEQESAVEASSVPTRIVILRPGLDSIGNNDESWAGSSCATEERSSIEDFLEEVKERLKCELQGQLIKRGSMVRGGGIETPYSEKPSDPKLIAQRIAKQVRESVTKDLGMDLLRSESTRSYRSEFQYNGTSSPEFISRDTRRFLSERLRNVLKRESHSDVSKVVDGNSGSSRLTYDRRKLQFREILTAENDIQSRSFRCGPNDDVMLQKDLSPGNLVRSLSAPVSGTSFGKLLLEDRHVTGAHIRRKHEAIEKLIVKVKKQSKEKFNFREKVSSFKYSFILRGKLFGRKIHSAVDSRSNERDFVKDIMSGPTVMMNFSDRPENSTEVPPSPASVCSSVHEEYWRAANCPSPVTPGALPLEEHDLPQAFREISYNLNVLRKQLNQLETSGSEEANIEEQPGKPKMVELEDQDEAYVRDLLVASGLYDKSSDKSLSRWDPFAKPISIPVFEQVENSYNKKSKEKEGSKKKVGHKVLLDLLNEALSLVLAPPVLHTSKFRRTATGTVFRPPHGKTLLDHVWEIMRVYLSSPADKSFYSFDSMVARDLHSSPWSGLMNDDLDALGKEMESQIMEDLIEEMVVDMNS